MLAVPEEEELRYIGLLLRVLKLCQQRSHGYAMDSSTGAMGTQKMIILPRLIHRPQRQNQFSWKNILAPRKC